MEIVKRRLAFEQDPIAFAKKFQRSQSTLRKKILAAMQQHERVQLTDAALIMAANLCDRLGIDGHRGELAVSRAALALAAFENASTATPAHVRRVAGLALAHRLRKDPLESASDDERVLRLLAEIPD